MENTMIKKYGGLTSFQLKILGIILMVFDHIHQMFYMNGIPLWFTGLGRLVAPIFLFLLAEGFYYTRNKKKYMARLWIAYVLMALASNLIQKAFPLDSVMLMNSIFGTLFLGLYYMYMVDLLKFGIKEKNAKKIVLSVVAMVIPYLISFILMFMFFSTSPENSIFLQAIMVLLPLPLLVEGGTLWIVLAVAFYLLRDKKIWIRLMPLVLVSILVFVTGNKLQSLMIFAAIPLAMYNGKPGRKGAKYFFYIFYPAHIYFLYIISYVINK
ncbi:MAG: TraX family protein [Peptostreptococcus sp.]|uniref:TraX family protein n=1 Tax=Peptostreptococcus sp. TaxID=1262 RepID=UPI002FC61CFA